MLGRLVVLAAIVARSTPAAIRPGLRARRGGDHRIRRTGRRSSSATRTAPRPASSCTRRPGSRRTLDHGAGRARRDGSGCHGLDRRPAREPEGRAQGDGSVPGHAAIVHAWAACSVAAARAARARARRVVPGRPRPRAGGRGRLCLLPLAPVSERRTRDAPRRAPAGARRPLRRSGGACKARVAGRVHAVLGGGSARPGRVGGEPLDPAAAGPARSRRVVRPSRRGSRAARLSELGRPGGGRPARTAVRRAERLAAAVERRGDHRCPGEVPGQPADTDADHVPRHRHAAGAGRDGERVRRAGRSGRLHQGRGGATGG